MNYAVNKALKNKKGFTLIELIVVVIIIGILAALAIPRVLTATGRAKTNTANSNLKIVQDAVERYYVENNDKYPPVLLDLLVEDGEDDSTGVDVVNGPFLKAIPKNPLVGDNDPVTQAEVEAHWDYEVDGPGVVSFPE